MRRWKPWILVLCITSIFVFAACASSPPAAEETDGATTEETDGASGEGSEAASDSAAGEYSEAPMLTEQVEAGDLPPVDERLPNEPLVQEPY